MLNAAQKEAVEYVDGPLLIIAGAGTGKTTVITEKIYHLISSGFAKPEEILALTFTEKAAAEMVERVDSLLTDGYIDLQISTFHAFCQQLLEMHGLSLGVSTNASLLTEIEAWMLVRKHLYDFDLDYYRPLGSPNRHIHALLNHFSKCKDELITPEEYLSYSSSLTESLEPAENEERKRIIELAQAYKTYNQLLLDNESVDFGDLVYYAVSMLRDKSDIRKKIQTQYKYVLVDEFQDVNWAQYQLVRLLSGGGQLTVVGDDDQSIYAFRGASVSNILRFTSDYKNVKEVVLQENYRSGQAILDIAYAGIQHNNPDRLEPTLGIEKKLIAKGLVKDALVQHVHKFKAVECVNFVIEKIQEEKRVSAEMAWSDFAILVRANNAAIPYINALEQQQIPYIFLGSSGLYRQPVILDCINFFKAVDGYRDSTAIYRLLHLPFLSVDPHDVQKIIHFAKKKSVSYYFALKRAAEVGVSNDASLKQILHILDIIDSGVLEGKTEKPTILLYSFLEKSGYLEYLAKEEGQGNISIIQQIYQLKQFFTLVEQYETSTPTPRVKDFLEYFHHRVQAGDTGALYQPDDAEDGVRIMTVHASKGLEFSQVFIPDLVEGRFPARRRGGGIELPENLIHETLPVGDYHYQEERRLFYVAVTRAKEKLYLLSADDYGGARKRKISRFLSEVGYLESNDVSTEKQRVALLKKNKHAIRPATSGVVYPLPKAFSFSQLRNYQTCPYQYKLAHILKIPVRGNASFSFGNTMHNTLHKFYLRVQELNSPTQTSLFDSVSKKEVLSVSEGIRVPTFLELEKMYKDSWIGDWYQTEKQRKDFFAKGLQVLETFYEVHKDTWRVPLFLESGFTIKVGSYTIRGKIDRIDQLPDGTLEIIDYKTGKSKEKLIGKDKEQLLLYQVAAQALPQYRHVGDTTKLTFYYLNDEVRTSFVGKQKDLARLEEKIVKTLDRIHEQDFAATPSQQVCSRCDFRDICDYRA